MAPRPWATAEQLDWLNNELPVFLKHQAESKVSKFWKPTHTGWFVKWPEEEALWGVAHAEMELTDDDRVMLGEAVKARKKQLKNWFNNESKKGRRTRRTTLITPALLGMKVKGTRCKKVLEVYSEMYYEEKVAPIVRERLNEDTPKAERINIIRAATAEAFQNEPTAIQDEVRAAWKTACDLARQERAKQANLPENGVPCYTPAEYQFVQEQVPTVLEQFLTALSRTSGWHFSVLAGGPCPKASGTITSLSYHIGKTPIGHDFGQSFIDFDEHCAAPFGRYLEMAFPRDMRARFDLNSLSGALLASGDSESLSSSSPSSRSGSAEPSSSTDSPVDMNTEGADMSPPSPPTLVVSRQDDVRAIATLSIPQQQNVPATPPILSISQRDNVGMPPIDLSPASKSSDAVSVTMASSPISADSESSCADDVPPELHFRVTRASSASQLPLTAAEAIPYSTLTTPFAAAMNIGHSSLIDQPMRLFQASTSDFNGSFYAAPNAANLRMPSFIPVSTVNNTVPINDFDFNSLLSPEMPITPEFLTFMTNSGAFTVPPISMSGPSMTQGSFSMYHNSAPPSITTSRNSFAIGDTSPSTLPSQQPYGMPSMFIHRPDIAPAVAITQQIDNPTIQVPPPTATDQATAAIDAVPAKGSEAHDPGPAPPRPFTESSIAPPPLSDVVPATGNETDDEVPASPPPLTESSVMVPGPPGRKKRKAASLAESVTEGAVAPPDEQMPSVSGRPKRVSKKPSPADASWVAPGQTKIYGRENVDPAAGSKGAGRKRTKQ